MRTHASLYEVGYYREILYALHTRASERTKLSITNSLLNAHNHHCLHLEFLTSATHFSGQSGQGGMLKLHHMQLTPHHKHTETHKLYLTETHTQSLTPFPIPSTTLQTWFNFLLSALLSEHWKFTTVPPVHVWSLGKDPAIMANSNKGPLYKHKKLLQTYVFLPAMQIREHAQVYMCASASSRGLGSRILYKALPNISTTLKHSTSLILREPGRQAAR